MKLKRQHIVCGVAHGDEFCLRVHDTGFRGEFLWGGLNRSPLSLPPPLLFASSPAAPSSLSLLCSPACPTVKEHKQLAALNDMDVTRLKKCYSLATDAAALSGKNNTWSQRLRESLCSSNAGAVRPRDIHFMNTEKDCFYSDKQKASSHRDQIVNAVLLLHIVQWFIFCLAVTSMIRLDRNLK